MTSPKSSDLAVAALS